MRNVPSGRERRSGQALVEFALILPVFLLIFFGIVDAGRLIVTYNTIANASRSAARVAIVNQSVGGTSTCDTTSTTAYPVGCAIEAGSSVGTATADVSVMYRDPSDTTSCASMSIGCLAVVTVTGHFQALTPIIGQVIGPMDLDSTTKIPIERVCANEAPPAPLTNC